MRFKLLVTCMFPVQMWISVTDTLIPESLWILCHSIWNGSLTMEWNTTPCSIFASVILCNAFVGPGVFLLEIRNFKDSVWVFHFDFAGERDSAGSPPTYFRDRAAKEEQNIPKITVSPNDQSVIKHPQTMQPCELLFPTNETTNQTFLLLCLWSPIRLMILRINNAPLVCPWIILRKSCLNTQWHWLTFPEQSIPVSPPIPSQLALNRGNELLFWVHIHPLLLQKRDNKWKAFYIND